MNVSTVRLDTENPIERGHTILSDDRDAMILLEDGSKETSQLGIDTRLVSDYAPSERAMRLQSAPLELDSSSFDENLKLHKSH